MSVNKQITPLLNPSIGILNEMTKTSCSIRSTKFSINGSYRKRRIIISEVIASNIHRFSISAAFDEAHKIEIVGPRCNLENLHFNKSKCEIN